MQSKPLFPVLACFVLLISCVSCQPTGPDLAVFIAAGDKYDVRVLRDVWGVPHIFGKTDGDTAFGLAYAHAEDDFDTIYKALLASRGQAAALEGKEAAPIDYMVHLLRIWDTIAEKYHTDLSPGTRAICQAYAAGLNYYVALHPDELKPGLLPVTGEDVVAGFILKTPFFYGLDNAIQELFAHERKREVSAKTAARTARGFLTRGHALGSNTFAVAPSRSADGKTRLNINSHQPWEGPLAWYEAHLHSDEGWDCVGGVFPGTPIILHGHNRHLGWAHTVNKPDLINIYVLTMNPDNPNQYLFDGEWYDLETRDVRITVRIFGPIRWPVKRECLWSKHHGPVVRQPHGTYAIRYAGMGELRQVEQWYRMNKAQNLAEFQDAMRMRAIPSFNVGYADEEGNIYYLYNAAMPIRVKGYDWQQYLPGDTSETVWTAYLPLERLPQVLNPPSGFIQNCNSSPFQTTVGPGNPKPEDFSPACGIETRMTNRALRALELLGGDESITKEEFYTYKFDMKYSEKSAVAEVARQILALPPSDDPVVREAVELIRAWDFSTDPENTSAAIALTVLEPLVRARHRKESDVMAMLTKKAHRLKEVYGQLDVPWRKVNRLRRGAVDVGLGGGPDILHAVYGRGFDRDGRLTGVAGDCYVLIVEWDKDGNVSSESIHQYGSATLDESSPHYADQVPLFIDCKMKPVWFDEADIRAHLEREYRPGKEL